MKRIFDLIISMFQLLVGLLGIITFIILLINGETMTKWIMTLLLSIGFVMLGIFGILDYKK